MSKKTIVLESIDPIEIYGAANKNLEALCTYFPNLKVVARGNEIILEGTEEDTLSFEKKLHMLIERRQHKMNVTPYDVEDLFDGESSPDRFKLTGESTIVYGNDGKPIKARNRTQQEMVKSYFENDLLFAVGPAGTGKTYIAIALAVRALKNREIKRIILTRPAVEAGESLGFLPGDLQSKVDPYLRPLYDALQEMFGLDTYQKLMERGVIEIAPLAYMRGRTLNNAFIILDEAQNTTKEQMKMFLTRMGEGSRMVITGDITQIDLPKGKKSGLMHATSILKNIDGIGIVRLTAKDVVRHSLVMKIIKAYSKDEEK
jgi:phosphate starvation-inducible PhoH-like protein